MEGRPPPTPAGVLVARFGVGGGWRGAFEDRPFSPRVLLLLLPSAARLELLGVICSPLVVLPLSRCPADPEPDPADELR